MGTHLNPGNGGFRESLKSKIYVDKTGLIKYTNDVLSSKQKYICVSRPRRFGKSVSAEMLMAYYGRGCDSHALFDGLNIAKDPSYETHINKYDVIFLNMDRFLENAVSVEALKDDITECIISDIEEEYPSIAFNRRVLSSVLEKTYSKTGTHFVFIIDEWDCVLRKENISPEDQRTYLNFLKTILKDEEYVALAYMTGILPIKKYGEHSALNMFTEISMTDASPLQEYTGFTEKEVKDLCKAFRRPFKGIKEWYDGYTVNGLSIYNPKSVVESLTRNELNGYWTQTETYEALRIYIESDTYGMHEKVVRLIAGEEIEVKTSGFQNDMVTFKSADDVMTLLVHLGYLTYDCRKKTVRIPNKEVRDQFTDTIDDMGWGDVVSSLNNSEELLRATRAGDAEKVAEYLDIAHTENSSILRYNDENSLACVIALAYYTARKDYTVIREMPAGRGFADMVFLPKKGANVPCMVIELKSDEAVDTAIDQIRERRYTESLKAFGGDILLVGISYGKTSKRHSCKIENIIKKS